MKERDTKKERSTVPGKTMNARKNERGEHGSRTKRTGDSTRPRQRNIRTQKEGSLSQRANSGGYVAPAYIGAWRSGDLDSGVICEARCVVPLSRSVLHAFAKRAARSGEQSAAKGGTVRRKRSDGKEAEAWREANGGGTSVFLADPPRRPLEENSRIETSWPLCTAP